ncbi:FISUMP domain-containing protein [Riemerella anatipestifer]|nr:FISUMP domain-containing protein [Riemerella anatipestifer]MDY3324228.1 FISUMP domain-containing protein [Riemerella anatipestifer]MDY3353043.1 FISUMP domain-containing protein [Riemerella anatipestifer]
MKKTLLCAVFLPLVLNAQDYSGRVGINTTEPRATLDVKGKGETVNTHSFNIRNNADTDLVIVKDNGWVGMGTQTPIDNNARLEISANSWFPLIINSTNTDGGGIALHPNDFSKRVELSVKGNGDFKIWSAEWERLVIDRKGNVGMGTSSPKASLDISRKALDLLPAGTPQGVIFPKFTTSERSTFNNVEEGTMIYNTDKKCLEMYLGIVNGAHQWGCLPDVGSNKAQSVAVTAAGFEGSYIGGVNFNNSQKVKFKLENNSFSNVSSSFADAVTVQNGMVNISAGNCQWQKLNGSTLIGSAASCASPNLITLNSGESALLTYTMSGTPETGTLQANFNKLGAQADQSTTVGLGSATITNPKTEYVVSLVYDGTTPKTEVQGKINNGANKLVVKIPYENGSGSYNAVTSQPVATTAGQGNDTNTLTLNIPAGNFGVNGYLDATISVDGDQEYLVKMLPPGEEYEIATIPYTLNGQQYSVVLKGIGGIPDRCFGKTTFDCVGYGAKELEHQFIYIPIQGPDGRTWLSNNLGAEYARIGSPYFNPLRQAGALDYNTGQELSNPTFDQIKRDWRAYGSLFQWQRNPDGHELMNWTSYTNGTSKYGSQGGSSSSWTNAGSNRFITSSYSWSRSSSPTNLWLSGGATNPCPTGYHVPTHDEQLALHQAITGINSTYSRSPAMWQEKELKLTTGGFRNQYTGGFSNAASQGWYWSGSAYGGYERGWDMNFNYYSTGLTSGNYTAMGFSVRCIKD